MSFFVPFFLSLFMQFFNLFVIVFALLLQLLFFECLCSEPEYSFLVFFSEQSVTCEV